MKELYSFEVKREVEERVPYTRKGKNGPIESTKKVKKTLKNRVFLQKPKVADVENAEFFYGQQFNEYINSGFLTKAMLSKKMESMGDSVLGKNSQKELQKLILENVEAARIVEFYGGSKTLTEAQKKELEEAKEEFVSTRKIITDYEIALREQLSQTADAKAENKLIEWFVFNFSFYEDEVDGKTDIFPIFKGEDWETKRASYLELSDPDNESDDPAFLKNKRIYDASYAILIRAISIWYNKLGDDTDSINASMDDLFKAEAEHAEDLINSKDEQPKKEKAKK